MEERRTLFQGRREGGRSGVVELGGEMVVERRWVGTREEIDRARRGRVRRGKGGADEMRGGWRAWPTSERESESKEGRRGESWGSLSESFVVTGRTRRRESTLCEKRRGREEVRERGDSRRDDQRRKVALALHPPFPYENSNHTQTFSFLLQHGELDLLPFSALPLERFRSRSSSPTPRLASSRSLVEEQVVSPLAL